MNRPTSDSFFLPPEAAGVDDRIESSIDDLDALVPHGTRVFKAGDSLAIRIPNAIAKHIALEDGAAVEMAVGHEMIYVRKATSRAFADLVERITPENVHEPLFDEPTGVERW